MRNFLVTGLPRCGKTTLVVKINSDSSHGLQFGGFITEEIREKGERIGFKILSLPEKKQGILARKGFSSNYQVGKYGVNLDDLERIGCASIEKALLSRKAIIIDEVGKMELCSEYFQEIFMRALNSPNRILATIMERSNPFADKIKKRNDIKLVSLNRYNFDQVLYEILAWLKKP